MTRAGILSTVIPGLGLHSAGGVAGNTGECVELPWPETLTSVVPLDQALCKLVSTVTLQMLAG